MGDVRDDEAQIVRVLRLDVAADGDWRDGDVEGPLDLAGLVRDELGRQRLALVVEEPDGQTVLAEVVAHGALEGPCGVRVGLFGPVQVGHRVVAAVRGVQLRLGQVGAISIHALRKESDAQRPA